jgi:hypothetical protein
MIRATICLVSLLASAEARAEWRYEETKGDTAGTTAYLLQTDSSIAVKGSGGKEQYPFLQLRCDKDGGQAYWRIHWFAIVATKIDNDDSRRNADAVRLQVRVDGKPDYREVWDMSRDASLESVVTDGASALVKALRGAKAVSVRVPAGYGKSYDAAFDVTGLEAALPQLKQHCRKL